MSDGLHPAPRFVIRQRVFKFDRAGQMGEGHIIVRFAILKLSGQHFLGHIQKVDAADVV